MEKSKALINVGAFLSDDKEVLKIIEMCDLDPIEGWKKWTDGNGNNLIIQSNKSTIHKKTIRKSQIKVTDLHFKSPVLQIAKSSKWCMISIAESVDTLIPSICFLWFLGNDDRLRLVCYMKSEWVENKPPLSSGTTTLRTIVKNLEIDEYKVIMGSIINGPYDAKVIKSWVTNWPPSSNLKLDFLLTNRTIGQQVLKDCGVV